MASEILKLEREQLRSELKDRVAGQTVKHTSLPHYILFNWQGLKHCISQTSVEPLKQFQALRQLPQLLTDATYSHYEPDSHNPPRKGVGAHVFYASCELGNQPYQVWLRVRETPDGLYFYALGVVK